MKTDEIMKLYDSDGVFAGVFVPASLWSRFEGSLVPSAAKSQAGDDLTAFNELLESWSFAYPYDPAVSCPACGSATGDWRSDPAHPFRLSSASLGGLLVFQCEKCGATIRHKYFRRHVAKEYTA